MRIDQSKNITTHLKLMSFGLLLAAKSEKFGLFTHITKKRAKSFLMRGEKEIQIQHESYETD